MTNSLEQKIFQPKCGVVLPFLLLTVFSSSARADFSDTLHPFAGGGYSHEDNLLRLSDALRATGIPSSDNTKTAFVGLEFERPVGRQLFVGSARISKVSFDKFSEFDYNGKDANGQWKWQLGNDLSGTLGATYSETLSSFNDFHSAVRNVRTQKGGDFELRYQFIPHWQLRAHSSQDRYDYEAQAQRYLNRKVNLAEVGVDYLAGSGSSIGIVQSRAKGEYPNPIVFSGFILDQAYRQTGTKLRVKWQASALTQLEFLGGRAHREHTFFTGADSSGANGRLSFNWMPGPALAINLAAWRDYSPFEGGGTVSYSQDHGASAAASWQFKPQLQFALQLNSVKRDFFGASSVALPNGANDKIRNMTLSASYNWTKNITVSAKVFNEHRTAGSILSSSFSAKGAAFNASLQF